MQSVLNSDYENIEYIIVNDDSTDQSSKIIQNELAKVKNRKILFFETTNQGESEAINFGFQHTNGDYILIVNADDPIKKDLISTLVKSLDQNINCVVAYPDWQIEDQNGNLLKEVKLPEYKLDFLVGDFVCIPGPGSMFRKSALLDEKPRNKSYKYVSDFEMWLRLSIQGEFQHVTTAQGTWRKHSDNLSFTSQNGANARELIELNVEFFRNLQNKEMIKFRRRSKSYVYYHAASMGITDESIPAIRYLFKSLFSFYLPRFNKQHIRRKLLLVFVAIFIREFKKWKNVILELAT